MNSEFDVNLDGKWQLRFGKQDELAPNSPCELNKSDWPTIDASVPGNVELDLIDGGYLPKELEKGNNVYEVRKYETYRWWHFRKFVSPKISKGQRVKIVFKGLDCLAHIWINSKKVGSSDNMLIEQEFDVTDFLYKEGERENEIYIRIDSPVLYQF